MNKKYVKPIIAFQQLNLGTELSAQCAMQVTFEEWLCPIVVPELGETIFQEHNCDWSNDDLYVCYHVPMASMNIFSS